MRSWGSTPPAPSSTTSSAPITPTISRARPALVGEAHAIERERRLAVADHHAVGDPAAQPLGGGFVAIRHRRARGARRRGRCCAGLVPPTRRGRSLTARRTAARRATRGRRRRNGGRGTVRTAARRTGWQVTLVCYNGRRANPRGTTDRLATGRRCASCCATSTAWSGWHARRSRAPPRRSPRLARVGAQGGVRDQQLVLAARRPGGGAGGDRHSGGRRRRHVGSGGGVPGRTGRDGAGLRRTGRVRGGVGAGQPRRSQTERPMP